MAKISKAQGPTYTATESNALGVPRRAMLGEVDRPSAGNNTEQSQESTPSVSDSQTDKSPKPAPTTGSPSNQNQQVADYSAPTTGGNTPKTPAQSAKPGPPPRKQARARTTTQDDF